MTSLLRRAMHRDLRFAVCALGIVWAAAGRANAATVGDLRAEFRKGQTFITFSEIPGANVSYAVYRSTTPIVRTAGLKPITTVTVGSGMNRYTNKMFVVRDLGAPLAAGTGLLVYTPKDGGSFYYAVTNSADDRIVPGTNATQDAVAETPVRNPGAVLLEPPGPECGGSCRMYKFFAWEDVSTWRQANWGYYGNRYNVIVPIGAEGVEPPYALTVSLHGAGDNGYKEPYGWGHIPQGVIINPVDFAFLGITDPYTNAGRNYSRWFGYYDPVTHFAEPVTERRIVRYVELVRDDPQFRIDPTRISVFGGSMGGGGAMHLASHYPKLFAAALAQIGWLNTEAWGGSEEFPPGTRVSNAMGPVVTDYQDLAWMAARTVLSPIIHAFNKDDPAIKEGAYPDAMTTFERFHQPYMAQWKNGGHAEYPVPDQWDFLRFRSNEAHPAFANASNSDAVSVQEGQRNGRLDWSSSLHSLGDGTAIVDTPKNFAITLSAVPAATVDVTIRNAQQFHPAAGMMVEWQNLANGSGQVLQSGTVAADSAGLVTVRVQIPASKSRLSFSCATCTAAAVSTPSAPQNVRIVRQ